MQKAELVQMRQRETIELESNGHARGYQTALAQKRRAGGTT